MLMARNVGAADNPHDAIFASRRGTWLSPNNVRRQWRQARADTDLDWVTPHSFRVATLIKEEADTKSAAAQLGHSSEEVTATYYIAKPVQAPDVSDVLERLAANPNRPHPPARFSGAFQISIEESQSPDRVSAGQVFFFVGTAGFEPTTP
ncbi:tyrosine-type recombinase/integrase [Micromonospora sp. NPDC049374]|uniref:tyrosine-type recombinase/integrase n=1 Tax=Micromonospora sp. NPDC049374 TaxID=3154352 RepID=UPI00342EF015